VVALILHPAPSATRRWAPGTRGPQFMTCSFEAAIAEAPSIGYKRLTRDGGSSAATLIGEVMERPVEKSKGARKGEGPTCGPDEHARRSAKRKQLTEDAFVRAASLFRAAGDVSRLKILDRLSDGEWCVTELAEASGVGMSTVSQQLRTLRAERIVTRRRTGKHFYYSLADEHVSDIIHAVLEHSLEERAGAVLDDDGD
jgi:DNA-binding transcriptional ArsR family regulator